MSLGNSVATKRGFSFSSINLNNTVVDILYVCVWEEVLSTTRLYTEIVKHLYLLAVSSGRSRGTPWLRPEREKRRKRKKGGGVEGRRGGTENLLECVNYVLPLGKYPPVHDH